MTPERWRQIEDLYHAARERKPEEREALMAQANTEVRGKVEALLAQDSGDKILDRPAWEAEPSLLGQPENARLTPGAQIGPYKIEAALGAGGMGDVYRAVDTRLSRMVAIKVAKERFSERFEREARAIAAMNHPNICTLYDVGPNYLVMEYIDGVPLKGPLPLDRGLKYAGQICDALDAAHKKGIIHRDLKPGNIMVTKSGVKVLDFGLAKSQQDETLTATNAVMGTPKYMAPEQREGKECDERTDIYALGLVLREMAADYSPHVAHVVERCLANDPDERWQATSDVRRELEWAATSPATKSPAPPTRPLAPLSRIVIVAPVVLAAVGAWAVVHFRQPSNSDRVVKLQLDSPRDVQFLFGANSGGLALSPDGKTAAYVAGAKGKALLWVQPLDGAGTARPLPGTEDGSEPFFSPDGRAIAFFTGTEQRLQRVDLAGGAPLTICDVVVQGRGGVWGSDGQIVFGTLGSGLFRVPAAGGTPVPFTTLNASRGETSHRGPQLLPGGRVLYWIQADKPENTGVYASSLTRPNERTRLLTTDLSALYAPGGDGKDYLLWLRSGTGILMAQEFDASALKLAGEPYPIADPVASVGIISHMDASASANGLLIYSASNTLSQFTWLDRAGKPQSTVGEPGEWDEGHLSHNGRHAAAQRNRAGGSDLWILDTERGVSSRFTLRPGINLYPVWSPEDRTIVFSSGGPRNLFRKETTGAGMEQRITQSANTQLGSDWSRDGRFVMYREYAPGTQNDLWVLPVTPEGRPAPDTKPRPYLRTSFNEWAGRFSPEPNPRWVAYHSDESGKYEAYIDSFPEPRRKIRISTTGGYYPEWGPPAGKDGQELFYLSPDNKLMAVKLKSAADSVEPSAPRELFALPITETSFSLGTRYDVAPDGNRFLVRATPQQASPPLTVIINWPALLKRASPAQ